MSQTSFEDMACPLPITTHPRVLMAHGGGGRLMNQLIDAMFRAIGFTLCGVEFKDEHGIKIIPLMVLILDTDVGWRATCVRSHNTFKPAAAAET